MAQPIWERKESIPTLPSLANITNPTKPSSRNGHSPPMHTSEPRDSGNWSLASTHSSYIGPHVTLPPIDNPGRMLHPPHEHSQYNSYSSGPGNGPYNPISGSSGPQSPTNGYAANRSQTSLHQSITQGSVASPSASRRSSFDSRLNNLHLDSQVSLPSLAKERGIYNRSPGVDSISRHSFASSTNGFGRPSPPAASSSIHSPITNGPDNRPSLVGRIAPPIASASRFPYPHPNAPSPTKGFPYAFPDPDIAPPETIPEESSRDSRDSSIYSGHSGMVSQHHGHLTVESGPPSTYPSPYSSHPTTSTLPYSPHSSQSRLGPLRRPSMGLLTNDSSNLQSTPYSRTPELRISHKLAERKRRKEMKVLFDELRDLLPSDRGGKTSKWEILTKAIEHVRDQQNAMTALQRDVEPLKQQNHQLQQQLHQQQEQIDQMRHQLQQISMQQNGGGHGHPGQPGAPNGGGGHHGHQSRESQSSAHSHRMQY